MDYGLASVPCTALQLCGLACSAVQSSCVVWYVQCSIEMSCANHPLLLTTLLAALATTGLTLATELATTGLWPLDWQPLD